MYSVRKVSVRRWEKQGQANVFRSCLQSDEVCKGVPLNLQK